jgi:hypothetical protein
LSNSGFFDDKFKVNDSVSVQIYDEIIANSGLSTKDLSTKDLFSIYEYGAFASNYRPHVLGIYPDFNHSFDRYIINIPFTNANPAGFRLNEKQLQYISVGINKGIDLVSLATATELQNIQNYISQQGRINLYSAFGINLSSNSVTILSSANSSGSSSIEIDGSQISLSSLNTAGKAAAIRLNKDNIQFGFQSRYISTLSSLRFEIDQIPIVGNKIWGKVLFKYNDCNTSAFNFLINSVVSSKPNINIFGLDASSNLIIDIPSLMIDYSSKYCVKLNFILDSLIISEDSGSKILQESPNVSQVYRATLLLTINNWNPSATEPELHFQQYQDPNVKTDLTFYETSWSMIFSPAITPIKPILIDKNIMLNVFDALYNVGALNPGLSIDPNAHGTLFIELEILTPDLRNQQ